MAEIHHLTATHLPTGATPMSVVSLLADLLSRAQRGELRGIAAAWVEGEGTVITSIVEGCAGSPYLVAGVSALFHDVNCRWKAK